MVKEKLAQELQGLKEDVEDLQRYMNEFASFLPVAVFDVTLIGIIIFINKAFQELTSYREIDIVGEPIETIFLEKKEIKKIIDEISKKEVVKAKELTLLSKKKKKIPVSIAGSVRKDRQGNIIGYFISIIDISVSKKLQEELEQRVQERTKELQERVEELEKFHRLTVGRELRMIELKTEIKGLKEELERYKNQESKN